jgi:hypothetical protein
MVVGAESRRAKPQAAGFLQISQHVFGLMFMFADDHVHVVGHDGTGVTSVCVPADCFSQAVGDGGKVGNFEIQ